MADDSRDKRGKRPTAAALLDRVNALTDKVLKNHEYDGPAWEAVVEDMRGLPATDETRAVYNAVLAVLPSAAVLWTRYLELEVHPVGSLDNARQQLDQCLLRCPRVDLYLAYIKFVKRLNEAKGAQGAVQLKQAYEFALQQVGQDIGSGPLWTEYIQFLQAAAPKTEGFRALFPTAMDGQEEAARTFAIRHVYQQAVLVPTHQLEAIWKQYEVWEPKNDRQLAKKILDEWRPKYQGAKNVLRDRKRKLEKIAMDALPLPPGQGGSWQVQQVQLWKEYLQFECTNWQRLEPDSDEFNNRINLAFTQCLSVLYWYPEVWHQYASVQLGRGDLNGALAVLDRAKVALPGCSLLHFFKAELYESTGNMEEAKQVYEDMVKLLEKEVPPSSSLDSGAASASEQQPPGSSEPAVPSPFGGEQGALIWLQYIRFIRRTASKGEARLAFLRARRWHQHSIALAPLHAHNMDEDPKDSQAKESGKSPKSTSSQLYSGMAHLEWSLDKTNAEVPCRLYELGLEDPRLGKDAAYIVSYAKFLIEVGDVDNARALIERCLAEREVSASVDVWRTYATLEAQQGNLQAALQVEDRMRAALAAAFEPGALPLGSNPPLDATTASLQVTVCRYSSEGVVPCEAHQALYLERAAALAPPAPAVEEASALSNGYGKSDRGRDHDRDRARHRDGSPEDFDRRRGEDTGPPDLIDMLIRDLPPPHVPVEGPLIPVQAVMDVAVWCDMTAATMTAVSAELDAGRLPSGAQGVEVPMVLGLAHRPYPDDLPPPRGPDYPPPHDAGPPPYHPPPYHDPQDSYPPYPPHDRYGPPPPHAGPPAPIPMTRKRRWEGPPDGRGPPPYDSGPPPYELPPPYDDPAAAHYDGYRPPAGPPPPHWYEDRRPPPR